MFELTWNSRREAHGGLVIKNLHISVGDIGLIHGLGRSPVEGNGNLLQYPCLANPMDRGAWQATVHRVSKELYTHGS